MAESVQFVGGLADGQESKVDVDLPPYFFFYVKDDELARVSDPDSEHPDLKKAMYYRLKDTSIYVWVRTNEQ